MFIEAVLLLAGGSVDCSDLLVSGLAGAGLGHTNAGLATIQIQPGEEKTKQKILR